MFMSAMILMRLTSAWPISTGQLDDFVERTVDAEAHPHAVFARLDVHVGGAVAQRLRDDLVDDLHDRRVRVDHRLDRGARRRGSSVASVGLERFDVGVDRRQRAVGLVDAVAQLRGHAERDVHFLHRQRTQQRDHFGVERIGDRDGERAVGEHERQHVVAVRVGRVDRARSRPAAARRRGGRRRERGAARSAPA